MKCQAKCQNGLLFTDAGGRNKARKLLSINRSSVSQVPKKGPPS